MNFDKFYSSLTPDERAYFIAVTDIFHDKPYNVIGRPSLSTQKQNTTVLNLERTITQADFGIVGGEWDCNIVSLPFITSQVFANADDTGYYVNNLGNHTKQFGGLTAYGTAAGGNTVVPGASPHISLNANTFLFPDWNTNAQNPLDRIFYEILSIGFEVWNVTPELYRGGSQVRYRVPCQGRKAALNVQDAVQGLGVTSPRSEFFCYPMPPSNASRATQFPDSVICKAAEGNYAMHTLQDAVSDYYMSGNERVFLEPSVPPGGANGNCWCSGSTTNPTYDYDPPLVRGDFDMVGSYFTGLSEQTALTLRYRVIISTVPNSDQAQLTSLAKVSPDYNAKLLSLISHVQADFPPGVPVSMNPKGEWFKQVLSVGKKVMPKVIPIAKDLLHGDYVGAGEKAVQQTIGLLKNDKKKMDSKVTKHDQELEALKSRIRALESLLGSMKNSGKVR